MEVSLFSFFFLTETKIQQHHIESLRMVFIPRTTHYVLKLMTLFRIICRFE